MFNKITKVLLFVLLLALATGVWTNTIANIYRSQEHERRWLQIEEWFMEHQRQLTQYETLLHEIVKQTKPQAN